MKVFKAFILMVLLFSFQLHSVIPMYYGARSLSLGYSSSAYNYDINSLYLNPGLLSGFGYFITGYQNQSDFSSYKGFGEVLGELLAENIQNFDIIGVNDREVIHDRLKELFTSKHGMYGFTSNSAGAAFKRYGFSIARINTSVINPERAPVLDAETTELTQEEINGLNLSFTGLSYTQYSVSYSLDFTKEISIGVTMHYLSGSVTRFLKPLVNEEFTSSSTEKDYLKYGWSGAEDNFGKFLIDLSVSASLSTILRVALILKNYRNPVIETEQGDIILDQRTIAAVSIKPDQKTGIYLDLDLKQSDLYLNGELVQPVSLGVERAFFNGNFFVRLGIMSDLTEKYLFGSKGKLLYGVGLGVYIKKVLIDAGIGIGGDGKVNSFAVSGFFIVK